MKIFKAIYSVIVAFIIIVAVLLIISTLPITGNYKAMTVISGSMEPAIKIGSVVVVKPSEDYQIGEIVSYGKFGKNNSPITHRIVEITNPDGEEKIFRTQGDANDGPDQSAITKEQILGKVLFAVPYLGYAVDFAKKPLGFALIIIVPALAIIADEIKNIIKELKTKKTNGNIQN